MSAPAWIRPRTYTHDYEGHAYHVRCLTIAEREAFESLARKAQAGEAEGSSLLAWMLAHCVCNPDGSPMLTDDEAASVDGVIGMAMFRVCLERNGLGEQDPTPAS